MISPELIVQISDMMRATTELLLPNVLVLMFLVAIVNKNIDK